MSNIAANPLEKRPDSGRRELIESATDANLCTCWTCGSCDLECPVNIATKRLRPQVLVRLASFGFLDELAKRPEIWYCLRCRRCIDICPNLVKPATVIEFAREESIRANDFGRDAVRRYYRFFARFQRVRWRTVEICMKGEFDGIPESRWADWLHEPVPEIEHELHFGGSKYVSGVVGEEKISACFTCGECSSTCPVSCEREVFDPRSVVRMAALGMTEFLMETPFIWLCITCGRCTEVCSQLIDGRRMIEELKETALRERIVDEGFQARLQRANRSILSRFIEETDRIFGFENP